MDSKALTPSRREALAALIQERAVAWSVQKAEAEEIDRLNIYQASRLAMKRAVETLSAKADFLVVDAMRLDVPMPQLPLVRGDEGVQSVAAASILAKVNRDACLVEWDAVYSGYGLARHKGYGTREHLEALERLGPTPQHRRSFAPVSRAANARAGRPAGEAEGEGEDS